MADNSNAGVIKASLTDGEMLALMNAAGVKPGKISPLANLRGQPASITSLSSSGMIDNSSQPTAPVREALAILANPASEIDLLWGSPDGISLSKVYAVAGQDKFVSFTGMNGRNNVSFPLTFTDFTDLIAQKLAFTDIKDKAALNIEVPPAALPVFFAVLDAYRESQLKAALERRQEQAVSITAEELNRLIQESKLETNYSWYTPVALIAMPQDSAVVEESVAEGIKHLQKELIIDKDGVLSDVLASFAYRAFPLAGFFGIKLVTMNNGSPERTQLAFFRGISTLLLAQATENNTFQISSISTTDLPEILFNLGIRQMEVPPPPAAQSAAAPSPSAIVFCGKCGAANNNTAKFCGKCGAPITIRTVKAAAGPKFCPKCGDSVGANEKFCDKCGALLK